MKVKIKQRTKQLTNKYKTGDYIKEQYSTGHNFIATIIDDDSYPNDIVLIACHKAETKSKENKQKHKGEKGLYRMHYIQ